MILVDGAGIFFPFEIDVECECEVRGWMFRFKNAGGAGN